MNKNDSNNTSCTNWEALAAMSDDNPDVMKWFQSQGVQPTEMINTVLRRYIENSDRQSA
jgi:uncharacterized protein (DUF4415 family)